MTCYQPGRSKTLSERGCIGFTVSPLHCFYWGAAAPQTPCCSWGASSPPDPLAGGLQPPVPPCIPRGSASRALRFFLVPRLLDLPRFPGSQISDAAGGGGCGCGRILRSQPDPSPNAPRDQIRRKGPCCDFESPCFPLFIVAEAVRTFLFICGIRWVLTPLMG